MKALVINSMFVHPAYRKCVDELGSLEGIDLTVLTADGWTMNGQHYPCTPPTVGSPYKFIVGKTIWKGKENRGFYISSLRSAFHAAKPDVIFLMEEPFSLFSLQILLYRELFAKEAPVVFFTWNNLSLQVFDYRPSIWYRSVAKWTLSKMQYALTANTDAISVLQDQWFSGPVERIGYGVDTSIFVRPSDSEIASVREELAIPRDAFVVGYVGRLLYMKGVDLLLEAFARLQQHKGRSTVLVIIGSGPEEQVLLDKAKQLGIQNSIRHLNAVSQTQVPKYMSVMDTLVLPSRRVGMWCEQFGRVLIEAMALGTIVIGSSSGAIPEVVGDAGLIFEENNSDELYQQLLKVSNLKEEVREAFIRRGKALVRDQYSWRRFAESSFRALKAACTEVGAPH